jgi:hypothetical protein
MSNGSAIHGEGTVAVSVWLVAVFQTDVYTTEPEKKAKQTIMKRMRHIVRSQYRTARLRSHVTNLLGRQKS